MLEIDLLLSDFLDRAYHGLSGAESSALERLLKYPDTILLEWLMGRERPMDGELAHVVERIRATAEY